MDNSEAQLESTSKVTLLGSSKKKNVNISRKGISQHSGVLSSCSRS